MNDNVLALTAFNQLTGPALYVGGSFTCALGGTPPTCAGGVPANFIAKWR